MTYPNPSAYAINDVSEIFSPGMVVFKELLEHNLAEMVRVAGGPERLRPHCKTHKCKEIIEMQVKLGVSKHKCATIAEAEMLADVGVEDVLLAYQMVGPNVNRLVQLMDKFPRTRFASLVDHPSAVSRLSDAICRTAKSDRTTRDGISGVRLDGRYHNDGDVVAGIWREGAAEVLPKRAAGDWSRKCCHSGIPSGRGIGHRGGNPAGNRLQRI